MLGQTSGLSSLNQNTEKVHINICPSANILRGTAQQRVELSPFGIPLWGHLKDLMYSAPIENEKAFHESIFDARQTICNRPGTY
jgi:hypothetical protein